MRSVLIIHPESRCDAVQRIEADIVRRPGEIALRYVVTGAIDDLRLPATRAPARADELWRHTCFEVFLRIGAGPSYAEFNFAPSTEWAAYRFSSYREGMTAWELEAPRIDVDARAEGLTLQSTLDLNDAAFPGDSWRLGLAAVIEETNGRKSYWALAHPAGRPDFHHSDCFALELAPASR